jgi:uncharacterized membrane protein
VSTRTWGILFIALAATSWGTWPLFTHGSPLSGVTIGFITLAVMSLPAPLVFRRADFADRPAAWWLLAVGLADAANVVLYFSALSRGPIVFAVLTHYLAPALVALGAPLILKEPRSKRALIATPLVLAGLSIALSAWFLTFFALLNLVTAPRVLKVGRAADQLGNVALSGNTGTLPEPELRALYDATVAHFGDGFGPKQEPQAKLCATLMREVHLRAARPIPSIGVSLVLVTVYVALIVYFLVGLVLLFANTQPASA